MSEPTGSLRKAAILIATLDTRSADRLLEQMGEQQAAKVREAVMELRDIDPAEQDDVIQEFMGRPGSNPESDDSGVEFDSSLSSKFSTPGMYESTHVPASFSLNIAAPRVADATSSIPVSNMLQNASPEKLAMYLEQEHPQLIAVVMVHLAPERAADVLGHFSPSVRSDVIHRVANVVETNPEVLREIELALDSRFQRERISETKPAFGLAAAQAIVAAAKTGTRLELAAALRHGRPEAAPNFGTAKETLSTPRKRVASDFAPSQPGRRPEINEPRAPKTFAGPQIEFQDVAKFENRELVFILGSVDPQVALLALTGAEVRLVDRILKQLPTRDMRAFREKMRQMGPLRVSDVLEAQQEFAREAGRLIAKGMIHNPFAQRVAAVA